MKKRTKSVLKYLLEFLVVAFGVFLGIYINEWQKENNLNLEKEKSINYIKKEIAQNREQLQTAIEYHQFIAQELDSISEHLTMEDFYKTYLQNNKFQYNQIKGWRGIYVARVEQTAFESAKLSGIIKEYDFKDLQNITKIYNIQDTYNNFGISLTNRMLNTNSSSKVVDIYIVIQLITTDLLSYEQELLEEIDKFL